MNFDDDDFEEEFSKEDWEREREEEDRRVNAHPMYVKAKEIMELVDVMYDLCPDETSREMNLRPMQDSAMIMNAKLNSALRTDSHIVAFQNAAIIREHGEFLRLSNHSLADEEWLEERYVKMFREEMEKFRLLFCDWVTTFEKLERYGDDEWGLFH